MMTGPHVPGVVERQPALSAPVTQPSTIRLAAVSDSHLVPADRPHSGTWHNRLEFETALPRLEIALQGSGDADPDAIVALGDIANFGDDASLDTAVARFAATRTTAWLVGGNHDTRGTAGGHALEQAIARAGDPGVRTPPPGGVAWHGIAIAGVPLEPGGRRLPVAHRRWPGTGRPVGRPAHCPDPFPDAVAGTRGGVSGLEIRRRSRGSRGRRGATSRAVGPDDRAARAPPPRGIANARPRAADRLSAADRSAVRDQSRSSSNATRPD